MVNNAKRNEYIFGKKDDKYYIFKLTFLPSEIYWKIFIDKIKTQLKLD